MWKKVTVLLPALAVLAACLTLPARAVVISGTYFEDTAGANCPVSSTSCTALFSVLPPELDGKFVNLTEVSCVIVKTTSLLSALIAVTDNGLNTRRRHHLQVERAPGPVSFQNNVDFKIAGGPPRQLALSVRTDAAGTIAMDCTVVGRVSDS